ncbi:MAG: hypothetical protein GF315_06440 [candidate division Zixibacteria bacterium]|nr:hypothetical protein [candidate division Zixibacteria bacterium]
MIRENYRNKITELIKVYNKFYQERNKIGISLRNEISEAEFSEVLGQIKAVCIMYPDVDILIDASNLKGFDSEMMVDAYRLFSKYRGSVRKVAITTHDGFGEYVADLFREFEKVRLKVFRPDEYEKARVWALSPDPTQIYT